MLVVLLSALASFGSHEAPASASSARRELPEKVEVRWPSNRLERLSLFHGPAPLDIVLHLSDGDVPVSLAHLAIAAPGLPVHVIVAPTHLALSPGNAALIRAEVMPASPPRVPLLPAHGHLVLSAAIQTLTVNTTLSDKVLFGSGNWRIASGARQGLARLFAELNRYTGQLTRITITGYADSLPDSSISNQTLSLLRARAVAGWLEHAGVPARFVSAKGAGAVDFVATNATAAGRERNRRVVVSMTLSRAARPAMLGAIAPAVLVGLPARDKTTRAPRSAPTHHVGTSLWASLAPVGGAMLLLFGASQVVRRRRRAKPRRQTPRWLAALPRWDRRRREADRQRRHVLD